MAHLIRRKLEIGAKAKTTRRRRKDPLLEVAASETTEDWPRESMRRSTANEPARLFIDTWGWLVLEDGKDPSHTAVHSLRRQSVESGTIWVTTDFVLDETITRLFSRRPYAEAQRYCDGIFQSIRIGVLALERITPERFERTCRLRLRYSDKPRISFTDLTSFIVRTELGIHDVLTEDAHFTEVRLGFRPLPSR